MSENSPHIIRVRQTTELASLISEILDSEAETAYLLVDDSASLAHHALNLRLLKREAESAGKRVVLVSENPRIQHLAAQASLEVHQNTRIALALAQSLGSTSGGARGMADIVLPSDDDDDSEDEEAEEDEEDEEEVEHEEEGGEDEGSQEYDEESSEEDAPPKEELDHIVVHSAYEEPPLHPEAVFRAIPKKRFSILPIARALASLVALPFRKASGKPRVALAGLGVAGGAGLLFFLGAVVLPSATIKITSSTVEEEILYNVVADSNVSSPNVDRGVVPAQILDEREEKTFTYKASGQENVETYAVGNLTVFNEYSSDAQTLVSGTRFLSADGKLFRTTETVVVPGA
ncbi:MAG: hypothetical protein WDZ44_00945, partial [Candidatus Spechtbacterales bacterium]